MMAESDGCMSSLPEELLVQIFAHLPVHCLRCVLPLVCKSWAHLSTGRLLWKNKTIAVRRGKCCSNGNSLLKFLRATPYVSKIVLPEGFVSEALEILSAQPDQPRKLLLPGPLLSEDVPLLGKSLECIFLPCIDPSFKPSTNILLCGLRQLEIVKVGVKELELILELAPILSVLQIWDELTGNLSSRLISLMKNVSLLKLPIHNLSSSSISELGLLANLKRLEVKDRRPSLCKLLELCSLPLHKLDLCEPFHANVLTSSALVTFLSYSRLAVLQHLSLKKSRLNDAGAQAIRKNCQALRSIEVDKLMEFQPSEKLTEEGLIHLLHLPLLSLIEIHNPSGSDWFYRRGCWDSVNAVPCCEENEKCRKKLDVLLEPWAEIYPVIEL